MSFGDYYSHYFDYHPGDLSQLSDDRKINGQLVAGFSHDGKPSIRIEMETFGKVTKRLGHTGTKAFWVVFQSEDWQLRQLRDWLVANVKD